MAADDLTRLRAQHPGWHIGTVWISAATGPDARRLDATRDGIRLHAWSAAELSAGISESGTTDGQRGVGLSERDAAIATPP
jgi:hypothetical protein